MKERLKKTFGGDKLILLAATVVVFALFTALNKNFLSWRNIVNILVASSLVGMVAIGHTYLIIAGQNDLSPGSVAAFSGVLAALLVSSGVNLWLSFLITIAAGALIGVFLIQAFNTGLTMVNVPSFWQYVAKGALLLFALTSDFIRKCNREKQLLEASKKNG